MPSPVKPDLNALPLFAAVAEAGGFTAAAERLGVSKARVSLDVARLEARLGVSLFSRTTRRVVLTEAGEALYARCVPLLRDMQEGLAQAGASAELAGTLRISAAVDYAAHTVSRAVAAFAQKHPRLRIELRTTDRVVDMLEEGIDVSLRMGWLRDSSLRAVRLGGFDQYLVASPRYLAAAPRLARPEDLAQHDWVEFTLMRSPLTWKFTSAQGRTRTARVKSRLATDSVSALRGLLESGCGISALDEFSAADAIRAGRLVRVLPTWALGRGGIHAVFPPGRHMPAKVRAFIDFYVAWLKQ
jgi:DNA-binding transcriptional LysR family regulator